MLKTGSKIALYAVLFALLFASAVGLFASTLGVRAAETPAEATKAVKISIDTQSSAFTDSETGIGGLQDDDYVVFGVSPLPIMVSTVDRSLKNDALGTWWNAWGEVEFTYDFWSPTPIAGMGGVNFENGDYTTVPNASIVDDKGYTSTCTDAAHWRTLPYVPSEGQRFARQRYDRNVLYQLQVAFCGVERHRRFVR